MDALIELRLTHPAIDFWIDVRLRRFEDAWLAVADLASKRPKSPWLLGRISPSSWRFGQSVPHWLVASLPEQTSRHRVAAVGHPSLDRAHRGAPGE